MATTPRQRLAAACAAIMAAAAVVIVMTWPGVISAPSALLGLGGGGRMKRFSLVVASVTKRIAWRGARSGRGT
jgi:hypothetical protein